MWFFSVEQGDALQKLQLKGRKVKHWEQTLWVPTEKLVFHAPKMVGSRSNWGKMVPFVLEEWLAKPVEETHFCFGKPQKNSIPVAVVSHKQMKLWIDAVRITGASVKTVLADLYALPFEEGRTCIWVEKGRCLVRTAFHRGFAGTLAWISGLPRSDDNQDGNLDVYADDIPSLPEKWRRTARPLLQPLVERFAHINPAGINLLQGQYLLHAKGSALWRGWLMVAALAVFSLASHLLLLYQDTLRLSAANSQLTIRINELFKKTTANEQPVDNLYHQVRDYRKRLDAYRQEETSSIWRVARTLDGILSSCDSCRVEEMVVDGDRLSFRLSSETGLDEMRSAFFSLTEFSLKIEDLEPITTQDEKTRHQIQVQLSQANDLVQSAIRF